jgi:peptidoglycan/xylan/chitin deacetylase (PgdA/CDA1 family)
LKKISRRGFLKKLFTAAVGVTVTKALFPVNEFKVELFHKETSVYAEPSGSEIQKVACITIDDFDTNQYELAIPMLKKYGYKAAVGVITKISRLNSEDLHTIQKDGHEVCSHGRWHINLDVASEIEARKEIIGSYEDLVSMGIEPKTFIYPYGSGADKDWIRKIVEERYEVGLAAESSYWNLTSYNIYTIPRFTIWNVTSLPDFAKRIKMAGENEATVWLFHAFSYEENPLDPLTCSLKRFDEYLKYLYGNDVKVVLHSELHESVERIKRILSGTYLTGYKSFGTRGRIYLIHKNMKYYVTDLNAFRSYGFKMEDVRWDDPALKYESAKISKDYLLDGTNPLPNNPYIAGDVNDGSLYYIPFYTYTDEKYPINEEGYKSYRNYLKTLPIRFEDPALANPTSQTILDGKNPIPNITIPNICIAKNPLNRVFLIFNGYKYYITNPEAFNKYGFNWNDVSPSEKLNPDNYPQAQLNHSYLLDGVNPLPFERYIVGDVNDGSLYLCDPILEILFPVKDMDAFNRYGFNKYKIIYGFNLDLPKGYVLDGQKPIPTKWI